MNELARALPVASLRSAIGSQMSRYANTHPERGLVTAGASVAMLRAINARLQITRRAPRLHAARADARRCAPTDPLAVPLPRRRAHHLRSAVMAWGDRRGSLKPSSWTARARREGHVRELDVVIAPTLQALDAELADGYFDATFDTCPIPLLGNWVGSVLFEGLADVDDAFTFGAGAVRIESHRRARWRPALWADSPGDGVDQRIRGWIVQGFEADPQDRQAPSVAIRVPVPVGDPGIWPHGPPPDAALEAAAAAAREALSAARAEALGAYARWARRRPDQGARAAALGAPVLLALPRAASPPDLFRSFHPVGSGRPTHPPDRDAWLDVILDTTSVRRAGHRAALSREYTARFAELVGRGERRLDALNRLLRRASPEKRSRFWDEARELGPPAFLVEQLVLLEDRRRRGIVHALSAAQRRSLSPAARLARRFAERGLPTRWLASGDDPVAFPVPPPEKPPAPGGHVPADALAAWRDEIAAPWAFAAGAAAAVAGAVLLPLTGLEPILGLGIFPLAVLVARAARRVAGDRLAADRVRHARQRAAMPAAEPTDVELDAFDTAPSAHPAIRLAADPDEASWRLHQARTGRAFELHLAGLCGMLPLLSVAGPWIAPGALIAMILVAPPAARRSTAPQAVTDRCHDPASGRSGTLLRRWGHTETAGFFHRQNAILVRKGWPWTGLNERRTLEQQLEQLAPEQDMSMLARVPALRDETIGQALAAWLVPDAEPWAHAMPLWNDDLPRCEPLAPSAGGSHP